MTKTINPNGLPVWRKPRFGPVPNTVEEAKRNLKHWFTCPGEMVGPVWDPSHGQETVVFVPVVLGGEGCVCDV